MDVLDGYSGSMDGWMDGWMDESCCVNMAEISVCRTFFLPMSDIVVVLCVRSTKPFQRASTL